jgi:MraZ protein
VFLAGTYELTIDAKNRLSIPFNIRRKLDERRDGQSFYVVPGQRQGTLALYPEVYFERLRPVLREESLSDETHRWRQFEFSQCALLDPDAQGRILLPERTLKRVGVGKDVVLIGVQDHLELWDRKQFEDFENEQWARFSENRAKAMQELRALTTAQPANAPTA